MKRFNIGSTVILSSLLSVVLTAIPATAAVTKSSGPKGATSNGLRVTEHLSTPFGGLNCADLLAKGNPYITTSALVSGVKAQALSTSVFNNIAAGYINGGGFYATTYGGIVCGEILQEGLQPKSAQVTKAMEFLYGNLEDVWAFLVQNPTTQSFFAGQAVVQTAIFHSYGSKIVAIRAIAGSYDN